MPQIMIHDAAGAVSVRKVPRGTLLLHALGGGVEAPCGGHGRCGKCRVTVQGALSLQFRECCGDQSADR